jgi:hypothetical protein
MSSKLWTSGVIALGLAVGGCAGDKAPPPSQRVENPAAGTTERPSSLSYGAVTGQVKKNQTTQLELLEMFGAANITTQDKDGSEVWVYERNSSVNDTAGSQQANQMSAFFGAGGGGAGVVAGGGVAGGRSNTDDQRRTVTSVRNLTVIVKFNPDKTVKDYTVRASSF